MFVETVFVETVGLGDRVLAMRAAVDVAVAEEGMHRVGDVSSGLVGRVGGKGGSWEGEAALEGY